MGRHRGGSQALPTPSDSRHRRRLSGRAVGTRRLRGGFAQAGRTETHDDVSGRPACVGRGYAGADRVHAAPRQESAGRARNIAQHRDHCPALAARRSADLATTFGSPAPAAWHCRAGPGHHLTTNSDDPGCARLLLDQRRLRCAAAHLHQGKTHSGQRGRGVAQRRHVIKPATEIHCGTEMLASRRAASAPIAMTSLTASMHVTRELPATTAFAAPLPPSHVKGPCTICTLFIPASASARRKPLVRSRAVSRLVGPASTAIWRWLAPRVDGRRRCSPPRRYPRRGCVG